MMTKRRAGFTLIELLVVIAIVAVLIGLGMAAVQSARASARRIACGDRLKQIALATLHYESTFNALPIGCRSLDDPSYPLLSWLGSLLPFVEQSSLWESSVASFRGGSSSFSHEAHRTAIPLFGCPADPRTGGMFLLPGGRPVGLTSFLGVSGVDYAQPNGVLIFQRPVRVGEISDGQSQTLMIGERPASPDGFWGWWYSGAGQNWDGNVENIMGVRERNRRSYNTGDCPVGPYNYRSGRLEELCDVFHFWSLHAGGANFAFCDGGTKFIPYSAEPLMADLATRDGRTPVAFDFHGP